MLDRGVRPLGGFLMGTGASLLGAPLALAIGGGMCTFVALGLLFKIPRDAEALTGKCSVPLCGTGKPGVAVPSDGVAVDFITLLEEGGSAYSLFCLGFFLDLDACGFHHVFTVTFAPGLRVPVTWCSCHRRTPTFHLPFEQ